MKKMQCESCGGQLEINEGEEYATCPFCKTKYKLNEEKNVYFRLDDDVKKGLKVFGKFSLITFIIGSLISLTIIISVIILFVNISKNFFQGFDDDSNGITNVYKNVDKEHFNFAFERYNGSESGFFLKELFDEVITNNKKNSNRLITIKFNEQSSSNIDDLKAMKKNIVQDLEYEVEMNYNNNGYIDEIIIEVN